MPLTDAEAKLLKKELANDMNEIKAQTHRTLNNTFDNLKKDFRKTLFKAAIISFVCGLIAGFIFGRFTP
jgi:uncharacterized membrane-anchored protein YhcB (DUF1043 family)